MNIFRTWKNLTKYEKRLVALLFLATIPNAFPLLTPLISNYMPGHRCDVEMSFNNFTFLNEENKAMTKEKYLDFLIPQEIDPYYGALTRSSCSKYNISSEELQQIIANTSAITLEEYRNQSRPIVPCQEHVFNLEEGETSATKEFHMICEDSWKMPTTTTAFLLGSLIGIFLGSFMSDRFGRRLTFLIFTTLQFLASTAMGFSVNYFMFIICMALNGTGSAVNFTVGVLLGCEQVKSEHRNFINAVVSFGFSVGYMLIPLLAYFLRDWRWFVRTTGFLGILFIPLFWLINESPSWLQAVGKTEQSLEVRQKIAKYNGTKVEDDELVPLDDEKQDVVGYAKTFWSMLKQPRLLFRALIMYAGWFILSLIYYAIALNMNSLSGNRFLNSFFAGLSELVANILAYIVTEKFGRRNSFVAVMTFTGCTILFTPLFRQLSGTALTVITLVAKTTNSIGYYAVSIMTVEIFPTSIRQSAVGIAAVCGALGPFLAPFLLYGATVGSGTVAYVTIGAVVLIHGMLMLFVPKTHNVVLPQTVEDALQMKSDLPCLRRKK